MTAYINQSYTNTNNGDGNGKGALTFSSGIWKSVYLLDVPSYAITYMVPTTHYQGDDPSSPLQDDTHAGFKVAVKLFIKAGNDGSGGGGGKAATAAAQTATVEVVGSWGASNVSEVVLAPSTSAAETVITVWITATAAEVELWYPNGAGKQPLYNVTASVSLPSGEAHHESSTNRRSSSATTTITSNNSVVVAVASRTVGPCENLP